MGPSHRHLGAALLLVALVFFLPVAQAESVSGVLTVQGATLPAGAETTFAPEAALIRDTERTGALTLTAPWLLVTVYEKQYVSPALPFAPEVERGLASRSFVVTVATLAKASTGEQSGYLGFSPAPSAVLRVIGSDETTLTPSALSTVKSDNGTEDAPTQRWYVRQIEGPHLLCQASGALSYDGPGAFKLYGPDVTIQGAENQTPETFRTGFFQDDALTARHVWLVIEATDANLIVDGSARVEVATKSSVGLDWNGAAIFTAATGELRAEGTLYEAKGSAAQVEGSFSGTLTPESGSAARLDAQGTLLASTLLPRPVVGGSVDSPFAWGLVVAGGAGAAGALALGARAILRRSKARRESFRARMDDAASRENWTLALHWAMRLRRRDRGSAEYAYAVGMYAQRTGDLETAIAAFEESSALGIPYAMVDAALCAKQKGDDALALALARRAVWLTADNADHLGVEPLLRPLLADAEIRQALAHHDAARIDGRKD